MFDVIFARCEEGGYKLEFRFKELSAFKELAKLIPWIPINRKDFLDIVDPEGNHHEIAPVSNIIELSKYI